MSHFGPLHVRSGLGVRACWSQPRRVVAKAEHLAKGSNPRFVVTSLPMATMDGQTLYEQIYCARGDMENRIKEQQLDLFAGRTSAATMKASAPPVAGILRLRPARGAPPDRPPPQPGRRRHLGYDPPEAAEDRGSGADQRAPARGRPGLGRPISDRGSPRLSPPEARRRLLTGPASACRAQARGAAPARPETGCRPPRRTASHKPRRSPPRSRSEAASPRRVVESRKGAVAWAVAASPRFPSPLIKPDVPISGIRLSDWLHPEAHGGGPRWTRRSRSTPSCPNTASSENRVVPRDGTLWRRTRKRLVRS
jgi:hypothetical protein